MSDEFTIGEAARASGVKIPTIRYYEQTGLLPIPSRTDGGRRTFTRDDIRRLSFIRHARELGFEPSAIRTLLGLQENLSQSCEAADKIAREHLMAVDQRIASLTALKAELEGMIEGCRHGRVGECSVIEVLADHGQCMHARH